MDKLRKWRLAFRRMVEAERANGHRGGIFDYTYWWWPSDVNWTQGPTEDCPFRFLLFCCGDRVCGRRI